MNNPIETATHFHHHFNLMKTQLSDRAMNTNHPRTARSTLLTIRAPLHRSHCRKVWDCARPQCAATLLTLLTLLKLFTYTPTADAANANPPGKMTFQGFLTDASTPPVPLGNASPQNQTVIFRIYDNAVGGTVKWAETQVVTVDKGHFSVLLGEGSSVSGQPHATDLSGVFVGADASDRWIGITVNGAEITPRIQFFAAPYAQLAKAANSLVSGAQTGNLSVAGDASFTGGTVSIGTAIPRAKLDVDGNIILRGAAGGNSWSNQRLLWGGDGTGYALNFASINNLGTINTPVLTMLDNGRVGIGTSTPRAPLDVSTAAPIQVTLGWYLDGFGVAQWTSNPYNGNYSIIANGAIYAGGYHTGSDNRIKQISKRTSGLASLDVIRQLQFTDYTYIDKIEHGTRERRGLIAQEVERILPAAITQSTAFVPDVYDRPTAIHFDAASQAVTIDLQKAHGLKVDDVVSLIVEEGKKEATVSGVPTPTSFVVKAEKNPGRVFVFGKQVKDFRTVDYDQVFSTGISAIQELDRQVQSMKKSEARVAELEQKAARVDSLEREVSELKKLVESLAQVRTEPRSSARKIAAARRQ